VGPYAAEGTGTIDASVNYYRVAKTWPEAR
jgi:hypothetical protein